MNRQTIVAGAIAVLLVGALVGSILYSTRNQLVLNGSFLRVRTLAMDAENTIVFADVRISNPSPQQFVVQNVEVFMDDMEGGLFSELEAQRLFDFYPVLGKKYNANLTIRQKINRGETIDRMVTVRVPATEKRTQDRGALRIVVTDVDGVKTEITEKRS